MDVTLRVETESECQTLATGPGACIPVVVGLHYITYI